MKYLMVYEDVTGKMWTFMKHRGRKFLREDGKIFSENHVHSNYILVSKRLERL
jgi:hypothetical protein